MTYGAKLNIALAVCFGALLLLAWLLARQADTVEPRLASVGFEDVRSIRIELPDRDALVFERVDDAWHMRAPLALDADPGRLHNIIDALNVPSLARYPAAEADPGALGLGDPPRARLVVDGDTYLFGDTNPVNRWRYVQHDGTVHLVNDVLFFRLGGGAHGWARRQPLPPGARIARIDAGEFTIRRTDDGWTLSDPDAEADEATLQRVVDAWATAHAIQVAAFDGHLQFENVAHIWLDGRDDPIDFILRRHDEYMAVIRPDVGLEYRLPLYRAEDLWILPTGDGE